MRDLLFLELKKCRDNACTCRGTCSTQRSRFWGIPGHSGYFRIFQIFHAPWLRHIIPNTYIDDYRYLFSDLISQFLVVLGIINTFFLLIGGLSFLCFMSSISLQENVFDHGCRENLTFCNVHYHPLKFVTIILGHHV